MLGWRWRGFCNTYSMTMLHFVPFTSIDRSSSSVGATSISFDSSCAARRCEKLSPNLCGRAQKGSLQDSGRPRTVLATIQGNESGLFGRVVSATRYFYAPPEDDGGASEGAATSRLAELQQQGGGDIEMGGWDSDDSDDEEKTDGREFMAAFFREVDEVKDGIHAVQRATRKIERITRTS